MLFFKYHFLQIGWILTFLQLKLTERIISVVCLRSLANDCGGVQQY